MSTIFWVLFGVGLAQQLTEPVKTEAQQAFRYGLMLVGLAGPGHGGGDAEEGAERGGDVRER